MPHKIRIYYTKQDIMANTVQAIAVCDVCHKTEIKNIYYVDHVAKITGELIWLFMKVECTGYPAGTIAVKEETIKE